MSAIEFPEKNSNIELVSKCGPTNDCKTKVPGFYTREVNTTFYSLLLLNVYRPSFEHFFVTITWPDKQTGINILTFQHQISVAGAKGHSSEGQGWGARVVDS